MEAELGFDSNKNSRNDMWQLPGFNIMLPLVY
jgi:hypothetical protein